MMRTILLPLLATACCLHAADIHVSPTGRDANPGTEAAPFQTLTRARDTARSAKAKGAVTVWLHGGTYWQPTPLLLGPEDSGTAKAPITYRAVKGEQVWLNGGVLLPPQAFGPVTVGKSRLPEEARKQVRQAKLPAKVIAQLSPVWPDTWWTTRTLTANSELFAGDRRLPLARWPNDDYTTFGEIVEPGVKGGADPVFTYTGDRPARWSAAENPFLYGYWKRGYRAEFIRIKAIDPEKRTIQLAATNSLGALEDGGASRYFAVNLLEELDVPGEWFLDRKTGILYLWPPAKAGRIVLSVNQTAVIEGSKVGHVTFRDLGIECSARDGISLKGSNHIKVVSCEVRNTAFGGIVLEGNQNLISGCDVHHTGDLAISSKTGNRYTLEPGGSVVDNNHIHHTNQIARAGSRAVQFTGVGGRLSHNLIHDTGYIAVRFHGNEHILEYNHLFRTNVESTEGGVFYIGRDWTARGSIIRYNFIHHVEDSREGCGSATRFVHLDDSAPEIEIHGNICYRLGGGVSVCGGAANNVHDNLFIECHWGVDIGPRGHDMFVSDGKGGYSAFTKTKGWPSLAKYLERYKWNQPPYSTRYPKLGEMFTKDPIAAPWFNTVTRNAMVDCGRGIREQGMEPGWSTVENNWKMADPGFVTPDRTKLDFRLLPSGELRKKGFQPIPFAKIGLYKSPDRRTWPVKYEPVSPDWQPRWMRLREEAKKATDGLPIFKVMKVTGKIVVDGEVHPMEWTPGDATGSAPEIHTTAELERTAQGGQAKRSSQAMVQTDKTHLYVNFRNPVAPAVGTTNEHRWGRDDAVEIALAELIGDKVGPIIVLRGFADGHWESSDEAGAPKDVVTRSTQGVRYASEVKGKALWSCEWAIPFAALGIDPATKNPRLAFNLSVRKPAGDEWVTWSKTPGYTHNVRKSGLLWLAQFGEMAAGVGRFPAIGRIDIDSRKKPVRMLPGKGCTVATWAKPIGCYLSASTSTLKDPKWQEMTFSFTPQEDGVVTMKLMGSGVRTPDGKGFIPVWTYADDLRVEGAELVNGGFEAPGAKGCPNGWRFEGPKALWVHDPKLAAEGEYCVKTWHNGRFSQDLKLTKGQTVTVSLKVRGR
jgi:parallel beta-helix repeat protein